VPLTFAAGAGWADVVELLLEAGADPAARDWRGTSALDVAASEIAFELISRALFRAIETRDQDALSWMRSGVASDGVLFARAIDNDPFYLMLLPPPVADGDVTSLGHQRFYIESRVLERMRPLVRIGADPNQPGRPNGQLHTALGLAVRRELTRAARLLLNEGADPNQRECIARYDNTYKVMQESKCNSESGITPLMSAASAGNREAVELLLEFKADRSLKDWAGRSALDYATAPEVRELLK
jgi:ankyrin repeat protein